MQSVLTAVFLDVRMLPRGALERPITSFFSTPKHSPIYAATPQGGRFSRQMCANRLADRYLGENALKFNLLVKKSRFATSKDICCFIKEGEMGPVSAHCGQIEVRQQVVSLSRLRSRASYPVRDDALALRADDNNARRRAAPRARGVAVPSR